MPKMSRLRLASLPASPLKLTSSPPLALSAALLAARRRRAPPARPAGRACRRRAGVVDRLFELTLTRRRTNIVANDNRPTGCHERDASAARARVASTSCLVAAERCSCAARMACRSRSMVESGAWERSFRIRPKLSALGCEAEVSDAEADTSAWGHGPEKNYAVHLALSAPRPTLLLTLSTANVCANCRPPSCRRTVTTAQPRIDS